MRADCMRTGISRGDHGCVSAEARGATTRRWRSDICAAHALYADRAVCNTMARGAAHGLRLEMAAGAVLMGVIWDKLGYDWVKFWDMG